MSESQEPVVLRRALNLPLLVFYGVGVTIGAGIFALIGEIVRLAGDMAPMAFLLAGLIAGATGVSYALLSRVYPRAGGEAVYANVGLGRIPAMLVGYGVTTTAVISSAVISLAFGGYLGTLLPVPTPVLVIGVVVLLGLIAVLGVRESVAFAAAITLLEVGTLVVVIVLGAPLLTDTDTLVRAITPPASVAGWSIVFSAAVVAFFAFIGFEDIVNMAEEAVNPTYVTPRAIIITLVITILVYCLVATIAIAVPDRQALTSSPAPLATLFESVTGYRGDGVSVMASIAMVNGILVQIVMASRVLYGMTREKLAPQALGQLHPTRQTPVRAILIVCGIILVLALGLPLVSLAQATSIVTLSVFTLVNLALWKIGGLPDAEHKLRRWRYWGLFAALLSAALLTTEIVSKVMSGA